MSLLEKGLIDFRSRSWPGSDQAWEDLRQRLNRYIREIELWNPRLGLVEASGEEIVVKHILDSLAAFGWLIAVLQSYPKDALLTMADIGSGAGLPGIPLLLALETLAPELAARFSLTLVDKQQRRVGFLLNAKAVLGLQRLGAVQDRLENLAAAQTRFTLVCCRAFTPLNPDSLALLQAIAQPRGCLFLYKGRSSRVDEELAEVGLQRINGSDYADLAAATTGQNQAMVAPLSIPFLDEERHLVLIRPGVATY